MNGNSKYWWRISETVRTRGCSSPSASCACAEWHAIAAAIAAAKTGIPVRMSGLPSNPRKAARRGSVRLESLAAIARPRLAQR